MFPQNYDWRYRVISDLLSPRHNPSHYWMAASGLALTGSLMLPFAGYLQRHSGGIAPRAANISAGTFRAGIIALICADKFAIYFGQSRDCRADLVVSRLVADAL